LTTNGPVRRRSRIGLLGGSFDPIHVGHLALGRAAAEALALDRLIVIPTGRSWQKNDGQSDSRHRLAMARIAVAPMSDATTPCEWSVGSDQLRNLATWHRWTDLLSLAHIAATQRERVPLSDLPAPIERLMVERGADALPDAPAGAIVLFRMPAVPVSATVLRQDLAAGRDVGALLPDGVADYIARHHLYAPPAPHPTDDR
jgi:nicotinate-nucleotide adenylyltransferase